MGDKTVETNADDGSAWVVDSSATGSCLLSRPCDDRLRAVEPAASDDPVAMALSGSGFWPTAASVGGSSTVRDIRDWTAPGV
jgi:hypothetical protein